MSHEVLLRIIVQHPLEGVLYGLQKGKGHHYETVLPQFGKGEDLIFDFPVQIKQRKDDLSSLGGPFVQGPAGSRFVYIGIGSSARQVGAAWNGRLKVPLPEAGLLETNLNNGVYSWFCTVPGSNKDGKPVFATVKPFSGWLMHQHADGAGA